MPKLNIDDNAAILAAIPAILGFTPEASIIVALVHDTAEPENREIRTVLRFDIDPAAAAKLTTVAEPVFRTADTAILVAVCADWIRDHAIHTLDVLRDSLAERDIASHVRLITPTLERPGQWADIDTGTRGPVTSFRDSAFAAETVLRGKPIADRRTDIVAEFTPTTNPVPFITADPVTFIVDTYETIAAIITGTDHLASHPDLATRVGILLTEDREFRDTSLLLCIDHAGSAAALWTRLANQLTGAARLEALTVAAACHYMAADAVRAGIALDVAATEANAGHRDYPMLANLLLSALQGGATPIAIRQIISGLADRTEN